MLFVIESSILSNSKIVIQIVMIKKHKILVILSIIFISVFLFSSMFWGSNTKIVPGYVGTNIRYISSDEGGQIVSMNAKEGDSVNRNQLLFSLDSSKNKTSF